MMNKKIHANYFLFFKINLENYQIYILKIRKENMEIEENILNILYFKL